MGNLLTILLILFVVLAVVIKVTEKHARPIAPEQQSKLWRILVILVFVSLIIQMIQYAMGKW